MNVSFWSGLHFYFFKTCRRRRSESRFQRQNDEIWLHLQIENRIGHWYWRVVSADGSLSLQSLPEQAVPCYLLMFRRCRCLWYWNWLIYQVHVPNFGGRQSRTGVGADNSIHFINIGRVGDKSFKEWRRKIERGRVGDNNILTFLCYWLDKKCHFKKLHFGQFFLFIFVKFSNSHTSLLVWKLCHQTRNRTYFAVFSGPNQFYQISINLL